MWHIQAISYYGAVREDKRPLYATIWMSLTNITWSKRSQTRKDDNNWR